MNRVALDFGVIQIYWYSIFILLAIFAGLTIVFMETKRLGKNDDEIMGLLINAIIVGIIGARLYFVIFNFSYYSKNILEIFEIWNGGLAIHGGILFGAIYIYLHCKKKRIDLLSLLDGTAMGLLLGQAIGRWGNFFNQEAFGAVTEAAKLKSLGLPNFIIEGMKIDGLYRQPTFLYESIWNLIGFIIMFSFRKHKYLKKGTLFSFYLIWYSLGRIVIEGMRSDSLMLGPIRVAQLISIALIALGIFIIVKQNKGTKLDRLYNEVKVKVTNVEAQVTATPERDYGVKKFVNEDISNIIDNDDDKY